MQLRQYQVDDLNIYKQRDAIANFSEQRTGKTPPVCTLLADTDTYHKVLIVCPKSLIPIWRKELKVWGNRESSEFKTKDFREPGVLVMNYENLRRSTVSEIVAKWKPDTVILDEAHRIKNRSTLTFVAAHKFIKAKKKIALTATPATNKPEEAWTILHWLFPQTFKSYWKFIDQYFNVQISYKGREHRGILGINPDKKELLQTNLDMYCIQHKRSEVMDWKDQITYTDIHLPPTQKQVKALNSLMEFFETEEFMTVGILDNLLRMRQTCLAPMDKHFMYDINHSPKAEWIADYLRDYPDKRVLVVGSFSKYLDLLVGYLLKESGRVVKHIDGTVSNTQRMSVLEYVKEVDASVLVAQIDTIKEGVTLDEVDTIIFTDIYPPAVTYLQAKDRIVATTPDKVKDKEIIHLMMEGTYDEELYALVRANVATTDVINNYKQYLRRN